MAVAAISSRSPAFDLEKDSFVIYGISNSAWLQSSSKLGTFLMRCFDSMTSSTSLS